MEERVDTTSERALKPWLESILSKNFKIYREHIGRGPLEKRPKLDFWMFPRAEFVEMFNFPMVPIALEVKGYTIGERSPQRAIKLVKQATDYALCEFPTKGMGWLQPHWTLVYPPLAILLGTGRWEWNPWKRATILAAMNPWDQSCLLERQDILHAGIEYALVRILGKSRCGELIIDNGYLEIRMNGGTGWSSAYGYNGAHKIISIANRQQYSH